MRDGSCSPVGRSTTEPSISRPAAADEPVLVPTAAARTRPVLFVAVLALLALAPASAQSARQGSRCGRPVVAIASPARGASVARRVVVQARVCSSSRIRRVVFSVEGARKNTDTAPPYRYTWDTRTSTDGSHTLRASAYDVLGRTGSSTATKVLVANNQRDKKAPSVTLTAPKNGATVSGSITVAAAATDNVGVTHVNFYLDGAPFASLPSAPYSVTWNAALAAGGSHTWKATAFDAAGNGKTSGTVSVTVANNPASPPPSPPPPAPSPPPPPPPPPSP